MQRQADLSEFWVLYNYTVSSCLKPKQTNKPNNSPALSAQLRMGVAGESKVLSTESIHQMASWLTHHPLCKIFSRT